MSFSFNQTVNGKTDRGSCKIQYPKKIYCSYKLRNNKILVSNGKSLVIKNNKNNPIILSTWNFGLPANEVASKVLSEGGNAMDAAEAGARHAESDEENNSVGYGGLPDENGNVTLDACVMDSSGNAGSVAFIQNIKHPVSVARKVMEETKHVMLVGEGARQFAISKGFQEIDLLTEKSEKEWKKWLKERREMTPHETHDTISVLVLSLIHI